MLDTEMLMARLAHFTKMYYLLHYLAFGVFLYARQLLEEDQKNRTPEEQMWYNDLVGGDLTGLSREAQVWLCWMLIVFSRVLRSKSMSEVVGSAIGFGKACICVSLFIADWYYPLYFVLLWILLFLVTSEPSFETPRRKFAKMDKKKMFDVVFTPVDTDKEQAHVYWFINVWANWQKSGASKEFNPVFAEMSAKYSNEFCKFTKIDAGRAPNQAVVKKLDVDDSALSKHMPSMILYKNGKEIQRLPCKGRKDVSYIHEYTPAQIEMHFNMAKIHEETTARTKKRREAKKGTTESKKER